MFLYLFLTATAAFITLNDLTVLKTDIEDFFDRISFECCLFGFVRICNRFVLALDLFFNIILELH